jgi:hypothetical protein
MAKFEISAPLKNWGLAGEFLPEEMEGTFDCKVLAVKKNEEKGHASAWIEIDDKTYIVDFMSLEPKEKNGVFILREEISITVEKGRVVEVN